MNLRICTGVALMLMSWAAVTPEGRQPPDRPAQGLNIGDRLPDLRGEYLTGRDARLPEDAAGKVTLVLMGFTYASRKPVEAWAERVKPALASLDRATFYEVPVIGGMARMGKWFIDSGMRRGTPKALHENVITVWGHTDAWKAHLGVTGATDEQAWLVLLDREGRVRWRYAGGPSDAAFSELMAAARASQ